MSGLDRERVLQFIQECYLDDSAFYRNCLGGAPTLYAACYALLTRYYLGELDRRRPDASALATLNRILDCQEEATGCFIGPELEQWSPPSGSIFDREHLIMHQTTTVLSCLETFDRPPKFTLRFAHRFTDLKQLEKWFQERDWSDPWLEGNNLLFVLQLLVYLRDVERIAGAEDSLQYFFSLLDRLVDPSTGLWGTDRGGSIPGGVYGGYHQLLAYYYEHHQVMHPERLVDSVLSLQHVDGGFALRGGGGACEDVDAIDILVNLYKLRDYRRPQIRVALRRCLPHLYRQQVSDGGFLYRRNAVFHHMTIPDTRSEKNQSNMFSTWFRVHTLALIAEVLTDDASLAELEFRFNPRLSMGWHRAWNRDEHRLTASDREDERKYESSEFVLWTKSMWRMARFAGGRLKHKMFLANRQSS
ncbi:hypothetical protein AB1K70_15370 [Bremerella sp. JC770]|uniref:hypothetical protein n=1 Tax=Bremerella sp. JC770 TaxID=3232137 RepID=UPI00345A2D8B